MSAPDIARVLAAHRRECFDEWCGECLCGWLVPEDAKDFTAAHRAHVADAIRAELRAWLESEGARAVISDAMDAGRNYVLRTKARAALSALADCVGLVDPSQGESGSTGIEVCQSADQTSKVEEVGA